MDRRQKRTRELIFNSFNELLKTKRYDHITVQEIIDGADVGRSTFYSHFETKDKLLYEMCTDIFSHVFSKEPILCEKTHDFSDREATLETKLTHVLYHIKYSRTDISGILTCDVGDLFIRYFKEYLTRLFSAHINEFSTAVDDEYLLDYLSSGFVQSIKWWIKNKMRSTPEQTARDFMSLLPVK